MWTFLNDEQLDQIREKLDEEHPSGLPGSTALSAAFVPLPFYSNACLVRAVNQEHEANTFYFIEKDGAFTSKKGGDTRRQEIDQQYGVHLNEANTGDYFRYIYFMANRQIREPLVETARDMCLDTDNLSLRERRALELVKENPLTIEKDGDSYVAKGIVHTDDGLYKATFSFRPGRALEEVGRERTGLTLPDPEFVDKDPHFRCVTGNAAPAHTRPFNPVMEGGGYG